jgi:hypothetical protein
MRLALAFLIGSMAAANASGCTPPSSQMARTELLFGAEHVSPSQWSAFLSKEVTPRFPDGLTVLDGTGQWKAPNGHIAKEKSHVLLIWHGFDQSPKIDAIRNAYKRRFHQQSVMRVDGMDCVSF